MKKAELGELCEESKKRVFRSAVYLLQTTEPDLKREDIEREVLKFPLNKTERLSHWERLSVEELLLSDKGEAREEGVFVRQPIQRESFWIVCTALSARAVLSPQKTEKLKEITETYMNKIEEKLAETSEDKFVWVCIMESENGA